MLLKITEYPDLPFVARHCAREAAREDVRTHVRTYVCMYVRASERVSEIVQNTYQYVATTSILWTFALSKSRFRRAVAVFYWSSRARNKNKITKGTSNTSTIFLGAPCF